MRSSPGSSSATRTLTRTFGFAWQAYPRRLHAEALPELQGLAQEAIADGAAWRLQIDTYEREVERYGGLSGVEAAERLFHADSEAAVALSASTADEDRAARYRGTLAGVHALLNSLGLPHDDLRACAADARDAVARDLGVEGRLGELLAGRYRHARAELRELVEKPVDDDWTAGPQPSCGPTSGRAG